MKSLIYSIILAFIGNLSFGQQMNRVPSRHLLQPEIIQPIRGGLEKDTQESTHQELVPRALNFVSQEVNVGSSVYDLQTNGSLPNRLLIHDSGEKVAVWMQSLVFDEAYPDRGTGINVYNEGWQPVPTDRIEQERTGWPSLSALGDGSLVVTSHGLDNRVHVAIQGMGESSWSESSIPTDVPNGIIWPRSATGGADGMTVHVIGLSAPSDDLEPAPYLGVDGHLLYARSSDGGSNWEITDQVIPGLDSSRYAFMNADSYSLQARGSTVVISVYGEWGDIVIFKSSDNGDTWSETIINDFPLDAYEIDDGYSTADIPDDPLAPDSLAIYTSSGEGATTIDQNGLVHVVYSETYVLDADPTDSASSYYPGWAGIAYWNESFTEPPVFIAGLLDVNGNDSLDITFADIPRYANGTATGMPTIVTKEDGSIFVTYAAVSEAHYNELDEQYYRHLIAVKSTDGGSSWGPAYDLINDDLVDPEFNDFIETVYPAVGNLVDDTLHILYQQDFFPGHRFVDEEDPVAENFIVHLAVPIDLIPEEGVSSAEQTSLNDVVKVYPTLARDQINIRFPDVLSGELKEVVIFDMVGRMQISQHVDGWNDAIDISALRPGAYIVTVSTKRGRAVSQIYKL